MLVGRSIKTERYLHGLKTGHVRPDILKKLNPLFGINISDLCKGISTHAPMVILAFTREAFMGMPFLGEKPETHEPGRKIQQMRWPRTFRLNLVAIYIIPFQGKSGMEKESVSGVSWKL